MRSDRAYAFLDRKCPKRVHPVSGAVIYNLLSRYDADRAVKLAEEDAEDALQELREQFAADIKQLVNKWDISDQKIDRLWIKEQDELQREIEQYKRDLAEAKERLRIAEKVIEDKNRQSRK